MATGGCLCGAVRIAVSGGLGEADACHCTQCRRQTGHFLVSANVPRAGLSVEGEEHVRWFRSSDRARRGFCGTCGSTLFWDPLEGDVTSVAMGVFDEPSGGRLGYHIYVADKGDYYEIADGLPQHTTVPPRR